MDPDMVESSYLAGLSPLLLPRVRHDRLERPYWEGTRLLDMHDRLSPGDVLVDVGSEMGDLSALYATWGCQVVMCEPNPLAWPWARATMEANGLTPKDCWWGFVSDEGRPGPNPGMTMDDVWPACAYDPPGAEHGFVTEHERGEEWPSTTLDELARLVVARIDAVTVDVEGYELRAMRGAERLLRDDRPTVWLSEHDDFMRAIGDDPMDLYDFMDSVGYEPTFLTTDHERHVRWDPM